MQSKNILMNDHLLGLIQLTQFGLAKKYDSFELNVKMQQALSVMEHDRKRAAEVGALHDPEVHDHNHLDTPDP
jgi:hypothetical protein